MSMFGWQLMALKSAEVAGLPIRKETRSAMLKFLRDGAQGKEGGLASYLRGERVKPSMTAEALFSRQILGMDPDHPAAQEAVSYLLQHLPRETEPNLYYWYYGTLAMYNHGGKPWQEWNESLRDTLVRTQRRTGHVVGSWDPTDPWGAYGGRLYSTAVATLCLEVYYRFLPMQQQTTHRDRKLEPR